ncbi:class II glutamine amidotransferase, partial [Streptomyces sp. Act-28]
AGVVRDVAAAAPGSRLNLLLTDGGAVTATAWGDTLWHLAGPGRRAVVASEPYDDDPGWCEAPDRTLLTAAADGVTAVPLDAPPDRPSAPVPSAPAPAPDPHVRRASAEPLEESPA